MLLTLIIRPMSVRPASNCARIQSKIVISLVLVAPFQTISSPSGPQTQNVSQIVSRTAFPNARVLRILGHVAERDDFVYPAGCEKKGLWSCVRTQDKHGRRIDSPLIYLQSSSI